MRLRLERGDLGRDAFGVGQGLRQRDTRLPPRVHKVNALRGALTLAERIQIRPELGASGAPERARDRQSNAAA